MHNTFQIHVMWSELTEVTFKYLIKVKPTDKVYIDRLIKGIDRLSETLNEKQTEFTIV